MHQHGYPLISGTLLAGDPLLMYRAYGLGKS